MLLQQKPEHRIKELRCKLIPTRIARELIIKNHYSHKWPGANILSYGVFSTDSLVGVITFGKGVCAHYIKFVPGTAQNEYLELTRVWIHDDIGKGAESRTIGWCLRDIKKRFPEIKWVISYSDLNQEHQGIIYRATNFLYTGTSDVAQDYIHEGSGFKIPSRTKSDLFMNASSLKEMGFTKIHQKGKHRYIYFLDQSYRNKLVLPVLPYPKKNTQSGSTPSGLDHLEGLTENEKEEERKSSVEIFAIKPELNTMKGISEQGIAGSNPAFLNHALVVQRKNKSFPRTGSGFDSQAGAPLTWEKTTKEGAVNVDIDTPPRLDSPIVPNANVQGGSSDE